MRNRVAFILCSTVVSLPLRAADQAEVDRHPPLDNVQTAAGQRIWDGAVGEGFRKFTSEAELSFGAGLGVKAFGTSTDHDLLLSTFQYGVMLGKVGEQGKWYAGNFELAGELTTGAQFYPDAAYFVSFCPTLRYNFATGTRLVPFVSVGAGPALTDIGRPDLGSHFEFHDQGGAGLHWFFSDDVAATVQCGFSHISNAGIASPNHGVNDVLVSVGVTWLF